MKCREYGATPRLYRCFRRPAIGAVPADIRARSVLMRRRCAAGAVCIPRWPAAAPTIPTCGVSRLAAVERPRRRCSPMTLLVRIVEAAPHKGGQFFAAVHAHRGFGRQAASLRHRGSSACSGRSRAPRRKPPVRSCSARRGWKTSCRRRSRWWRSPTSRQARRWYRRAELEAKDEARGMGIRIAQFCRRCHATPLRSNSPGHFIESMRMARHNHQPQSRMIGGQRLKRVNANCSSGDCVLPARKTTSSSPNPASFFKRLRQQIAAIGRRAVEFQRAGVCTRPWRHAQQPESLGILFVLRRDSIDFRRAPAAAIAPTRR